MKKLFFWALISLLILFLLSGICWLYADQLLDGFGRPRIEKLATRLIGSKVQIGRLNWTETGLDVFDLRISSSQTEFFVPRMDLDFTLGSLFNRQLQRLLISDPRLEITTSQGQGQPVAASLKFPDHTPINIELLKISGGHLTINTPAQTFQIHQLSLTGSIKTQSPFTLSGFVGNNDKLPIAIKGTVQFNPHQSLTLESLSWQGRQLLNDPLSLAFSEGELALDGGQIGLPLFDEKQLQTLLVILGYQPPLPTELAFSLEDIKVDFSLTSGALQLEVHVAQGQVSWEKLNSPFSALRFLLGQTQQGWEIDGQFQEAEHTSVRVNARIDQDNLISGEALVKISDPGALKQMVVGGTKMKVKGALDLRVNFSSTDQQIEVTTKIQGSGSTSPADDYLVNIGQLSGLGKFHLANGQESFSLALQQGSQPLVSVSGNFQGFRASLSAEDLGVLKDLLSPEQIPPQLQTVKGLNIGGDFSATDGNWTGRIKLTAGECTLSGVSLRNLAGQGEIRLTKDRFTFNEVSFKAEAAYRDTLASKISGQASADYANGAYSLVFKKLSVSNLNYNSADGLSGIGAAAVSLQGRIDGRWPGESVALDLNGTLTSQEVLSGILYANLSNHRADFVLRGKLNTPTRSLTAERLEIKLPKVGELVATGQFSPEQIRSQGRFDLVELTGSYGDQLKPLLRDALPQLTDLILAGHLALDYRLSWEPSGWLAHGELALKALTAHWPRRKLDMVDGRGTIPFSLGNGILSDPVTSPEKNSGEIKFGTLSVGPARLQNRDLQLTAELNRLAIDSPLRLALAGGTLTMSEISLGWVDSQPQGSLNIDIAGVELEDLTRDLNLPIIQGNLSARLGTIRYLNRQFSTGGIARIEVFGGLLQFSNMRYSEPFSEHPTFNSDIDFSGLDLHQATRTFDFGEMNGIIDGYVHELQLYGTTPASFVAKVATRETGTRNISVKALNNLSILSQGGISAGLSRGIYRFIDFYRYRKIAFNCSLVNDTFTLIGDALPGSNRHMVYGGLLPPHIDITTSTPTISFKEMMKRLGRIDRAGSKKASDANSNKGG